MYISQRSQKILKIIHLLTISCWIGGCLAVFTLLYASDGARKDDELFGILLSSRFVAIIVVVYMGAFASFFTGLAYSICTNRGFVRHKWIIIKWGITIFLICFGAAFLASWSTRMFELVDNLGLAATGLEEFQTLRWRLLFAMSMQIVLLTVATVISVYRPWEDRENAARRLGSIQKGRRGIVAGRAPEVFPARVTGIDFPVEPVSREQGVKGVGPGPGASTGTSTRASSTSFGDRRPAGAGIPATNARTSGVVRTRRLFPAYSKIRRK
ncbi:hypothetical protein LJC48_02705 [Desulfovibrio sp. OttesenSCG-928-C06]|nr:hypothetical protein [Desulfovibrio sp. OttesenSCG-928-C06]